MRSTTISLLCILLSTSTTRGLLAQDELTQHKFRPASRFAVTKASFDEIKRRAESGESESQYLLGAIYRQGSKLARKSDAEALKWFRKAADQKLPQAEVA